ncbi:type 4a pilus biogenesis protein PilO [Anaeromyxobacter sp. Fw109-5]|uniref:type 4a pilus biogenesis protein PilO n=1 Tax=Anaeromyxobacter sp. (strain Fw109-5) TaxID=404589 RepID=UPI0000ED7899|nr:type 4a pilus biogenesis protein PilO [Anaeromyxobacter sp. Fw109-5]ABS24901.1 type IV pilus biogenesis protein PilO [Anaeromyxobacter sp. Fw109-5]
MDQLIERVAKAPVGAKIAAVAVAVLLLSVLNYFVISMRLGPSISEVNERIVRAERDLAKLDKEFTEKTAIANNLNQFRREKELLEQQLREALAELPEEKKVDELLQLFQDRAKKAGLEIGTIEPRSPVNEKFYARLPIPMSVTGNFHEIATFFDSLGRMRRIVNVNDIVLDSPKDVSGKMVLNAKFLATAFMFVEPAAPVAAKPSGAKR